MSYREQLAQSKERHRKSYASFRECAAKLVRIGAVQYSRDTHRYYIVFGGYTMAAKKLMKLQSNIDDQSRLLLELERAIDNEEKETTQ